MNDYNYAKGKTAAKKYGVKYPYKGIEEVYTCLACGEQIDLTNDSQGYFPDDWKDDECPHCRNNKDWMFGEPNWEEYP